MRYGVPVYTSSPGDSSIGMNVVAMHLGGRGVNIDVSLEVNETPAIAYAAKRKRGKSAVWVLGGRSPKNLMLQTEPHIQEVPGLDEKGHDHFLQVTGARPDTSGLSGVTPSEAVSWGRWTRSSFRTPWSGTSTPWSRCRRCAPTRSSGWGNSPPGGCKTSGGRCWKK